MSNSMKVDASKLRQQFSKMVREAQTGPIVILRHEKPIACLVSFETWNAMMRHAGDAGDAAIPLEVD